MNDTRDTRIILLGGAAGTGKTTLAKYLSQEFGLAHRIGTGFIREVARCYLDNTEFPELFEFSFKSSTDRTPFEQLLKQTQILTKPIERCIERAHNEGTSIVIEGTHIVPGCIDTRFVTLTAVLYQPDEIIHERMFLGDSHSKRSVTPLDFQACRSVQEELISSCRREGVPLIDASDKTHVGRTVIDLIDGSTR